jgi:hypothetical protein
MLRATFLLFQRDAGIAYGDNLSLREGDVAPNCPRHLFADHVGGSIVAETVATARAVPGVLDLDRHVVTDKRLGWPCAIAYP